MNMNINYIIILIIISIVSQPYLEKIILKKINLYDVLLYKTIIYIVIIVVFYYFFVDRNIFCNFNTVCNNKKELGLLVLSASLSLIITFGFLYIVQNEYILSNIVPKIEAGIIILSVIAGYFFYKKKITISQILGILFILLGIYLISKTSISKN